MPTTPSCPGSMLAACRPTACRRFSSFGCHGAQLLLSSGHRLLQTADPTSHYLGARHLFARAPNARHLQPARHCSVSRVVGLSLCRA